jgi:hypothetical protein
VDWLLHAYLSILFDSVLVRPSCRYSLYTIVFIHTRSSCSQGPALPIYGYDCQNTANYCCGHKMSKGIIWHGVLDTVSVTCLELITNESLFASGFFLQVSHILMMSK